MCSAGQSVLPSNGNIPAWQHHRGVHDSKGWTKAEKADSGNFPAKLADVHIN